MPGVALIGAVVAAVLLLPVRIALHRTRTGVTGVVLHRSGSPDARRASALLIAGTLGVGLGPLLDLAGAWSGWQPADAVLVHGAGFVLLLGGIGWTFVAQLVMGSAWRIGQDEAERLPLVTRGPFQRVRHPIYSGMIAVALGVTLLDPTLLGLLGTAVLSAGAVLQALRVEEPHLREVHGTAYWDWARRTGRFLPRLR